VKTGTLKAQVGAGSGAGAGAGAGAETFLKVGAGAEKNSFGSATLIYILKKHVHAVQDFFLCKYSPLIDPLLSQENNLLYPRNFEI
jgi:hypothetical protein